MEEGGQPEQPAADTEQAYHVEEPEQSAEEAEAPAEPPQKAPKGREATKKTTKRSAAQVSHAMCYLSSVNTEFFVTLTGSTAMTTCITKPFVLFSDGEG